MKKTAKLVAFAESITSKYASPEDGPSPYSNPEDKWIDHLHTIISKLGTLVDALSSTRMGQDDGFRDEMIAAIEVLTKSFYKARDISRLGPNYNKTP
jgi:hypothetical protein